jgi:hypothetical protein
MRKLLTHYKRYHRWLINKRKYKQTMKEMFVEEVTQPMPRWGWVITGIGLAIMIYATINY